MPEIHIEEDKSFLPEHISNSYVVPTIVNNYIKEQLNPALSNIGLPELPSTSRLPELVDSGIFYNGKNGNTMTIETETREGCYVLKISGEGRCEPISKKLAEEIRKSLLGRVTKPITITDLNA